MTSHEPRPLAREISDFLAALRHRAENPAPDSAAVPGSDAEVIAWKSSLLDRIAERSTDPEVHQVAANAREQLHHARSVRRTGGGA